MKFQTHKMLALVTMLFSLVFAVTNVIAKKPPKPSEDVCVNFNAPDYVFWRDSHTNLTAQVTIYAAESTTGCEVKLLDIPLPEGPINDLKLAYSSDESDGVFIMGRVAWAIHPYDKAQSVWKYDFTIEEGQIVPEPDEPAIIMSLEDVGAGLDIMDLDLSPDMQSLVYRLMDYRDVEPDYFRIYTLDIADCMIDSCPFGYGQERYVIEERPDTRETLTSPVWGPLGSRIYFIEREDTRESEIY